MAIARSVDESINQSINIHSLNQLDNSNKLTLFYFNLKSRYTIMAGYIVVMWASR